MTGPLNGPPANAAPNPNYGRPFVLNNNYPSNFDQVNDREDERATAFLAHDFQKDGPTWWQKLLGVQTLTGMVDSAKLSTSDMAWQQYGYLGANTLLAAQMDGLSSGNFQNVAPQEVIYLGGSLAGKSLAGAILPRVTGTPTIGNQSINYFDFTPNPANAAFGPTNPAYYNGWSGQQTLQVTISEANPSVNRQLLSTSDSITRSVTTSQALVYEGKWLDDALVGIYGWRRDINKSWADVATLGDGNNPQNINFQNIGFSSAPQGRVEVQSRSYSLVAHLGRLPFAREVADRLPVDVSLAYNVSTNFQPDSARVDINGDPIAPPGGKTIERGLRFDTRDGKYSLKINRYVTTITNGVNPDGQTFAQSLANFVGYSAYYGNVFYYHTDQSTPLQAGPTSVQDGHPVIGQAANTGGVSGSGYYFESVNGVDTDTQAVANLQASSTAATRAWETQINTDFPNFFKNWGMGSLSQVQAGLDTSNQLHGLPGETDFAVTEGSQSKGWEIELDANPSRNGASPSTPRKRTRRSRKSATRPWPNSWRIRRPMSRAPAAPSSGSGREIAPSVPNVAMAYYNNYNGLLPWAPITPSFCSSKGSRFRNSPNGASM